MASIITKKRSAMGRRVPKRAPVAQPADWHRRRAGGLRILEAPPLASLDWLSHGFSTRPGGASLLASGPAAPKSKIGRVLNLGFTDWDSRANVLKNRAKFFHAIAAHKMGPVTLHQVHSDVVHRIDAPSAESAGPESTEQAPQGDALFTREPGLLLAVQTADCVPILLADPRQRAVAAIHAGWRGTLSRIAAKALGRMQMEFGTRPEDVIAALGPCIGRCCYEVGSEVVRDFDAQFPNARDWFDGPFDALASGENDPNWLPWLTMMPPGHQPPPLRAHLDLVAANHAILSGAGVPARQISSSGYCTACRTDLFFSYRRERSTGRLMAAIGIS